MAGLGEELRAAREARNLTLSDVSERIHIRTVYLQSLEDEDWSAIAAPVYVRGFLRTYARFLGLEPEHIVARFNAAVPQQDATAALPQRIGTRQTAGRARQGPSLWLWLAGAAAAVLVAFVAYSYIELQRSQGTPAQAVAIQSSAPPSAGPKVQAGAPGLASSPALRPGAPAPTAISSPLAVPGANGLTVRIVATSWLRVTVDGAVVLQGTFPTGTQRVFRGKSVTVRAGNAGGVDAALGGRDLGPLGAKGIVIERTFKLVQE